MPYLHKMSSLRSDLRDQQISRKDMTSPTLPRLPNRGDQEVRAKLYLEGCPNLKGKRAVEKDVSDGLRLNTFC